MEILDVLSDYFQITFAVNGMALIGIRVFRNKYEPNPWLDINLIVCLLKLKMFSVRLNINYSNVNCSR